MNSYQDLAHAMRVGAAQRPQCFEGFFLYTRIGDIPVASCALGAAYEGTVGKIKLGITRIDILGLYPDIAGRHAACPECTTELTVIPTIVHLNDDHHWTREAIADWLDTLCVTEPAGAESGPSATVAETSLMRDSHS